MTISACCAAESLPELAGLNVLEQNDRQLILEWQLEQCAALDFVFRYVAKNQQGLPENLAALESALKTALGRSSIVHFEAVAEIPPSPTGKVRWIINRTRRRENLRLTG